MFPDAVARVMALVCSIRFRVNCFKRSLDIIFLLIPVRSPRGRVSCFQAAIPYWLGLRLLS